MKFDLVLVGRSDSPAGGRIEYRTVGTIEDESLDAAMVSLPIIDVQGLLRSPSKVGNPGRQVIVRDVNDKIHEQWVKGDGPDVVKPKHFHASEVCTHGQIFQSAKAASDHLGFHNNEVAFYLAKVAHETDPNDRMYELRGVTVQYYDDAIEGVRD